MPHSARPWSDCAVDPRCVWDSGPDGTGSALKTFVPGSGEETLFSFFSLRQKTANAIDCTSENFARAGGLAPPSNLAVALSAALVIPLGLFRMDALIESSDMGGNCGARPSKSKSRFWAPCAAASASASAACGCSASRAQLQPAHGPVFLFIPQEAHLHWVLVAQPTHPRTS
jgi:hypothetical protein